MTSVLESLPSLDLDALLAAFVGTFVGAYAAFRLERRARALEEIGQRGKEGNLALLTLFEMFNVLRQFQKEIIEPAGQGEGRWLRMNASVAESDHAMTFDPARLHFLFEGEDKNMLPEVLLEGRRFVFAIATINRRNHLMLERVFPMLAAAGVQPGKPVAEESVKAILGLALWREAETLTEGIIKSVNEDVDSLKKTFDKLRLALVQLLPGQKFIRVELDMPAASKPAAQPTPTRNAVGT